MPLALRTLPVGIGLLAMAVGLIAAVDPMLAVVGAIAIAFLVVMITDLTAGFCVFVISAAFFEAIPAFGEFSAAKAIGAVVAVCWLATLAVRPSWRQEIFSEQPGFTVIVTLLCGWGTLSVLWSDDTGLTITSISRLILNALLFLIAYTAIRRPAHARYVIAAFIGGILSTMVYGSITGTTDPAAGDRISGAGIDPNFLALYLVAVICMGGALALRRRNQLEVRWVLLACVVFAFYGLFATASRGGLLAFAVVLLLSPFLAGKGRRLGASLLIAVALLGAGAYFTVAAPSSAVQRIEASDGGSGRTDIWRVAWRAVEDKPLYGVGLGAFPTASVHYLFEPGVIRRSDHIVDQRKVAHNTYLGLWAETGVIGLALFLLMVGYACAASLRGARAFALQGRRDDELMARGILLSQIAVLAGAFFVTSEYAKLLWVLLALGPVMLALSRRDEQGVPLA